MIVVFDIGATYTRIASSENGKELTEAPVKFGTFQDFNAAMEEMIRMIEDVAGGSEPEAIAGGVAGSLSPKGILTLSTNLSSWEGRSVREALANHFGVPVRISNDAALGGLGEAVFGAGKGKGVVAYVTIGTGVGGAKIVKGRIDENVFGFEPGHQILNIKTGESFEQLVSGSGVAATFGVNGENILDRKVWEKLEEYVATGLYNTLLHWSPDMLVLGGSLILHGRYNIEFLQERLAAEHFMLPVLPEIRKATLGDNSALYGGLALLADSTGLVS